jgi:hypothetical protein
MKILILFAFYLSSANLIFGQKKEKSFINKVDKLNQCQGYWKVYIPAGSADRLNNIQEGVYFNNKKIGVWITKTNKGEILKEDIYYDTLFYKVEEREYYLSHNIKSTGYMLASPFKDSTIIYDIIKKKKLKCIVGQCS